MRLFSLPWLPAGVALAMAGFLACTGDDPAFVGPAANAADGGIDGAASAIKGSFKLRPLARVVIGPNETQKVAIEIERIDGFTGAVKIVLQPLPEGVAASPLVIGGDASVGELTLTSAPTPPQANALVQMVGTAEEPALSSTQDLSLLVRGGSGARDTTFGDANGITLLSEIIPRRIARMNDDGVVIFGAGVVARVLPDGKVDTAFGTGGRKVLAQPSPNDTPAFLRVQKDGKIVIAGRSEDRMNAVVHRLLANGAYDSSFGKEGIVSVPFANGAQYIFGMDADNSGRVVLGIPDTMSATRNATFTRLLDTGAVDPAFSTNLVVGKGGWQKLLLRDEATPVVFGATGPGPNAYGAGLSIAGATPVVRNLAGSWNVPDVKAVMIDSKGRFLLAGNGQIPTLPGDAFVVRALPDGLLDKTFNPTEGIVIETLGTNDKESTVFTDVFDDTGKVLCIGSFKKTDKVDALLVRYDEGGKPDPTFGKAGKVLDTETPGTDATASVTMTKLHAVVVGRFNGNDTVLLRYWL